MPDVMFAVLKQRAAPLLTVLELARFGSRDNRDTPYGDVPIVP